MLKGYSAKNRRIDYGIVFGSEHGKRVLADLMRQCHVLEPTFTQDARETAFREGERNVALKILTALNYRPEDFEQLAKEDVENG